MRPQILGVIPARMASTRLPEKPLYPILGRPLLQWVWERARSMTVFDALVVATDSAEVADLCRRIGADVRATSPDHPSGTDRVAEVARLPEFRSSAVVVNLQGDEPLMEEAHVKAAAGLVTDGEWDVGTCASFVRDRDAYLSPDTVKVVRGGDGRALYFSRSPIPHKRAGMPGQEELASPLFLRHLGLYAYRREALLRWVDLPPSPLEELEMLEQLRPLEAGLSIGVTLVGPAHGGVDTEADARLIERKLFRRGVDPRMATGHDG